MSICYAEGQVCIRVEVLLYSVCLAVFHLSPHVVPVRKLQLGVETCGMWPYVFIVPLQEFIEEFCSRILHDFVYVRGGECSNCIRISEQRLGEYMICPAFYSSVVFQLLLIVRRLEFFGDIPVILGHDGNE